MIRRRVFGVGRWIATLYTVFFALIVLLEGVFGSGVEIEEGQEWEGFAVGVLAVAALAAVAVSWLRPHLATRVLLAAGLVGAAVALITAGSNYWLAIGAAGGPYLLGAALTALGSPGD